MTGDLVQILKAAKAVCATAVVNGTALGTERVVIGYAGPEQARERPVAMLWWRGDRGEPADGYMDHNVNLMLGVQAPHDESDPTQEENSLLEATKVYFAVRDALLWAADNLTTSGLGAAGVQSLLELSPQSQPEDYAAPGPVFAATALACNYHRDNPPTPGS